MVFTTATRQHDDYIVAARQRDAALVILDKVFEAVRKYLEGIGRR